MAASALRDHHLCSAAFDTREHHITHITTISIGASIWNTLTAPFCVERAQSAFKDPRSDS